MWSTNSGVHAIAISPNGTRLVSGSSDGSIYIWDMDSKVPVAGPLLGHTDSVFSVAFSPDGCRIVSGSLDKTIIAWDTQSGNILAGPFEGHTNGVYSVAFSPDSMCIASGSSDHTIIIRDSQSGDVLCGPLKGHTKGVYSIAFSPDGTRIVSGSDDHTIFVWDAQTGNVIAGPLKGHTDWVLSVVFSPDGGRFASSSGDGTIRIWDAENFTLVVGPLERHTSWVYSIGFSPDGARVVSGSDDCSIRIWDSHTGDILAEQTKGHTNSVNSVAFTPNGAHVVSGSDDCTIRMWNVQAYKKVEPLEPISSSDNNANIALAQSRLPELLEAVPDDTQSPDRLARARAQTNSGRTPVEIVSSKMSAREMFLCLLEHGCIDYTSRMDPRRYSSIAIAGGSFGDVWRGRLRDGTEVAIKCLRFHTVADNVKGLKRAMRELYIWSKAKHDNVQELFGVIIFQGRLGMVSPWMKYGNLQEYVRKYPDVDRYQLCIDVATGISYLHGIDMVHGDLKAGNVLVSQDGIAKISDFDHSILSNSTLVFSATTNPGGGTLRWMAPELLLSSDEEGSPPSARTMETDIYALGMTMLETISGDVPYSEYRNDMGIYRAIDRKKAPNRPKELLGPDERADRMWALLLECWDHDPAARPKAPVVLKSLEGLTAEATSNN